MAGLGPDETGITAYTPCECHPAPSVTGAELRPVRALLTGTLTACYAAMGGERDDFLARMNQFLSVLEQDASAVDRLLYAAKMETWMALRPRSRAPSGLATTSPRRTARCRTMSFGVTGTLAAGWSCYPGQVSLVFPVAARFGEQLDQILEHLLGEGLRYGDRLDVLLGAVLDLSDLFQLDTNSRKRGDSVVETLVVKIKTLAL